MLDFEFKMLKFALQMMSFVFKMLDFVLNVLNVLDLQLPDGRRVPTAAGKFM